MKKTEKLSILISIVLISLLAISAVSAAETDDTPLTQTSNDGAVSEPSTTDVQVKDTQDTTTTKESSSTDTVKVAEPDGTFTDLNNDINKPFEQTPNTNTINLTKDYKYDKDKDTGLDNGITFSTSELNGHTITVDGKGHTISGEGYASIFQIVYKNMDVTLKNLKITNAREGFAAINVNKATSLTLINVTFTENHGTSVIENNGTLRIEDSKFLSNSYAINSLGNPDVLSTWDVIIKNTTFEGNGGIAEFENNTVKIINSTFFHNYQGIDAINSGLTIEGGVFNETGGLRIADSALVMDSVKFIKVDVGDVAINAYTGCNNIYMNNVEFINNKNVIYANNSTIESYDSKFINNTEDVITASFSNLKVFNGLFEGNDEAILLMLSNATIVGTNFTDNGNGEADYGDTAIGGFNSNIKITDATFTNNTYGAIELLNGTLTIKDTDFINSTEDEAITAVLANITINGANFENNEGAINLYKGTLDITYATITNSTEEPAIIAYFADINIDSVDFLDNIVAIYLKNGTLNITDADFINNTEAIVAQYADIIVNDATFEDNEFAIAFINGTLDVNDVWFINNTKGAIYAKDANATISESRFADNGNGVNIDEERMPISVGAIYFDNVNGKLTVFDSEFTNNTAIYGGAIYTNGKSTIDICTFTNNTAKQGGAIWNDGTAIITGIFTGNNALTSSGGAIWNDATGNLTVTGQFTNNTAAKSGGAIYTKKIATIEDSTFTGNEALSGFGGAISTSTLLADMGKTVTIIKNTAFTKNTAVKGGAVYNLGVMNITDSAFTENNATENAGAIYHNNKAERSLVIKDTTFTNDYAPGVDGDWDDYTAAREIYVYHYSGSTEDEPHARIARLTNVDITNTFNYISNKEHEPNAPEINCRGCVYGDYHLYDMVPTFDIAVLNNVHNKTVLYITLTDNNGYIIKTIAYQWEDDDYTNQRKVLPFKFNVTGDINDLVDNGLPYINSTLSVGEHTITITYGGPDYYFSNNNNFELDDPWDYYYQVPKTTVIVKFNVTETIEELEKEVEDEKAIATDLAAQLEAAKQQVANLEKQLETAKGNASDLDKQLQAAKQQVANLTAQLNATNTELDKTKAALNDANNQINTLTITNNNLQSQLTAANNKADDANAKIKKVKAPKKVKKSKKLKITVTLSKKINGKYVYVIFNGKSYKAKAKNGVAKITIKKSALKKLGGKKIKYQIVYNQSLKNKTVKIKK